MEKISKVIVSKNVVESSATKKVDTKSTKINTSAELPLTDAPVPKRKFKFNVAAKEYTVPTHF